METQSVCFLSPSTFVPALVGCFRFGDNMEHTPRIIAEVAGFELVSAASSTVV